MDVRLSPEQQALRDAAARVVDRLGPRTVGELDDAERAAKLDAAVTASGWRELRTADAGADAGGGPLASAVEVAIVAEELSRGLADAPFLGPTLASELVRLARAEGGRAAPVATTVALTADLGSLASPATPGAIAIDAAGALAALAVDGTGRLVEVAVAHPLAPVDLTRPSAALGPPSASVDATTPVDGARPLGADERTRWTALGLALTSAELVGTMRGALALACDHAKDRHQYGAAIGSFQAVQHLLADAFVAMEGSRSAALHAAWAVDALAPADALAAGAVAKAYCARAARSVCETAIQVHGGIGHTWECLAHVHLRRALVSTDVLGGVGPNLRRVLAHQQIGAP